MKKIISAIFLTSVVGTAGATELNRPWYDLESLGVVVTYGSDTSHHARAGKRGCDVPGNCIDSSVRAISADWFTAFPFTYNGDRGFSFGPWIGQDIGWGDIGGADFMFGTTYMGLVLNMNMANIINWYGAAGYGLSYGGLFGGHDFEMDGFRSGFATMTGVNWTPFRGTLLAPLGFNFNIKFMNLVPKIHGTTPDTAGEYKVSILSSFGIFLRF